MSALEPNGWVYFIRPVDRPWVKIGWARSPQKRLGQLQCGSPELLELIFAFPGTLFTEHKTRALFPHLEGRGEWKRWSSDIQDAINLIAADPADAEGCLERIKMTAGSEVRHRFARGVMSAELAGDLTEWLVEHPEALSGCLQVLAPSLLEKIATVLPLSSAGQAA